MKKYITNFPLFALSGAYIGGVTATVCDFDTTGTLKAVTSGMALGALLSQARQAYVDDAARQYNSTRKIANVLNEREIDALKEGLEVGNSWRGYFTSFIPDTKQRRSAYLHPQAFCAGMKIKIKDRGELIQAIHRPRRPLEV
jgi:hypothetical protein